MAQKPGRGPNPIVDLLHGHSFPELAAALRAQTDDIIRDWEASVRRALPAERALSATQLRDHLPKILALLADALAEDNPEEARRLMESPVRHGEVRFRQHYDVQGFVVEYRLLRRIAVERVEATLGRRLGTAEDIALNMGIDDLLQRGIVRFVQQQEDQLKAAGEAEAKYLSFLSHDLRNNLNGVNLSLEVLKRRLAADPDYAEEVADLEAARHAIFETMDGMNRLLQAERVRKGADPKLAPVDLHLLASEVAHQFGRQAGDKGLSISVEVPPGATAHSDREWVSLVLQNLVGNAIKYSASGTVRVRCEPRKAGRASGSGSGAQGGWQVLSVSDQGPGIAPKNLKAIFEAFRRGHTHGEAGVGLGLAVASQAARRLGAELTVTSKVGEGSTFRLALPETVADGTT